MFYRDDYHWSPDIPMPSYSLSQPRIAEKRRWTLRERYAPRVSCFFGGKDGELLRKLTKITFWFLGLFVVSIEFHHGDTSMLLGKRFPLSHISPKEAATGPGYRNRESWHSEHTLDGPGGEVITEFCVPEMTLLRHLEVWAWVSITALS